MQTPVAPSLRRASTVSLCIDFALARPGRAALLGLVVALGGFLPASAAKWDPIDPADLALTSSTSSPGADAEILLSTHLMNEQASAQFAGMNMETGENQLVTENFIRAKVYTAKGVEDLGKFPIEFHTDRRVTNTEARVVKMDGTIQELKKSDIFESVLKKTKDKGERKQITFVFPGLEPGDVVEYRWTEKLADELWLETFFCQETLPVREYRFKVGEMQGRGSVGWMNCPAAETSDKDGFEVLLRNLPAFEEEENMPPLLEFRGWIFVAKTFIHARTDKAIWEELSTYWGDEFNMAARPSGAIRQKAEALAAGAATGEEKLRRLYDFCQKELFNTTYRTTVDMQAEIDKHKGEDAQSPAKTLERGRGRRDEINLLFAALARGLGFEARLSCNASRSLIHNVMIPSGWAFINSTRSVAVRQKGEPWRFFNPGCYYMPLGMMSWDDEGATALLCDTKKVEYGTIGTSLPAINQASRKGRFTLDAEGTLEGGVEEVLGGHLGITRKADTWALSLDDVNKEFREEVAKRLPNAEVSDIVWTNLENREMPLSVSYHVRVPGYAEQAGKRLVFSPSFFEVGAPAVFAVAERKFPICFHYPWGEHDDIEIVLPAGYSLDKPSAPTPVGDVAGTVGAAYKLQYNGKTRTFGYQRDFALGANGAYAFRKESYPVLKNVFELIQKSDMHSIMLKPKEASAAAPSAAAPVAQSAEPATQP